MARVPNVYRIVACFVLLTNSLSCETTSVSSNEKEERIRCNHFLRGLFNDCNWSVWFVDVCGVDRVRSPQWRVERTLCHFRWIIGATIDDGNTGIDQLIGCLTCLIYLASPIRSSHEIPFVPVNTKTRPDTRLPHGPSRVRVGRGCFLGHLIIWAGAVRPKTAKKQIK